MSYLPEVNLFDRAFQHLARPDGRFSMTDNQIPTHFKYIKDQYNWDGITLFTDHFMMIHKAREVKSKIKLGFLIETPETNPELHAMVPEFINDFDYLLTYQHEHLERWPSKTIFYPFGGSWITTEGRWLKKEKKKSKLVNMILSDKQKTTGHRLRHQIAKRFPFIDMYGSGVGKPFDRKEDILDPYYFSIVIENTKSKYYFSEKLLDAISMDTIPIYWGASNIGKFFNQDGIIQFDSLDELDYILNNITPKIAENMHSPAFFNKLNVEKFAVQENWLYEDVFLPRGWLC